MTIERIEYGVLEGQRPRPAGSNARLGPHGSAVRVPIVRLTTSDGASGFGISRLPRTAAERLLGTTVDSIADRRPIDLPLWDLAGVQANQPVHRLLSDRTPTVRCYDTSLYFDDLDIDDDAKAAALLADEAAAGVARGHAAAKIKVGRGARWMAPEDGYRRDLAIVRAVRDVLGTGAPIMVDANNGWNLNLTRRFLGDTADVGITWVEEVFHEDAELYADLHEWIAAQGLPTLIADGEGDASPRLLDMARDGLVDVVQYDVFGHSFSGWLETGAQLDAWGRRSAPHHYGAHLGNFVSGHLAAAINGFAFVEWDEVSTPGLDTSAYQVSDGIVTLPDLPGFGIELDEAVFAAAVASTGWSVS